MADRFNADLGAGFRGNPFGPSGASSGQRGGFLSEQNPSGEAGQEVLSSQLPGNPHSSRGFRRALVRTQRASSRLKDQLPDRTTFGGPKYRKPNYFAQGGQRHGMHIGAGAPATSGATQERDGGYGE